MPKLMVRDVAGDAWTLTRLHTALLALQAPRPRQKDETLALGTVRRYWYGTRDGTLHGAPLRLVDVVLLRDIAEVLGVSPESLIDYSVDVPGQPMPALA